MTLTSRTAVGAAGIALATLPLLIPVAVANSTTPRTKAQIEYAERSTAATHPSKAQVERIEREQASSDPGQPAAGGEGSTPSTPGGSDGGDAAAWQLALSAALGAAATGGVMLVFGQVGKHRHAVAQ